MINILYGCSMCADNAVFSIVYLIKTFMTIAFIVIPIIIIVMISLDFAKNVISGSTDDMNKRQKIAVKRIIYAIFAFFIPAIVNLLMSIIYNNVDTTSQEGFLSCWENATKDNVAQCNLEADGQRQADDEAAKQASEAHKNNNPEKSPEGGGLGVKPEEPENTNSGDGSGTASGEPTDPQESTVDKYTIYVGDSRTVGMCSSVSSSNEVCIAKVGMGSGWLKGDANKELEAKLANNKDANVIINIGVNNITGTANVPKVADVYVSYYKELKSKYPQARIIVTAVGPTSSSSTVPPKHVTSFNELLSSKLSGTGVEFCVPASLNGNGEIYTLTGDGIHYTAESYKKIYEATKKCL